MVVPPRAPKFKSYLSVKFYEHHSEPLASTDQFWRRFRKHFAVAVALSLVTIAIGVLGFKFIAGLRWIHSLVDSTMLMSGMGPVNCTDIKSTSGQLFASVYALFCGIVFFAAVSIVLAPVLHRLLHVTFRKRDGV